MHFFFKYTFKYTLFKKGQKVCKKSVEKYMVYKNGIKTTNI